eukprot:4284686-Pyramimonas_sp.AAC.1
MNFSHRGGGPARLPTRRGACAAAFPGCRTPSSRRIHHRRHTPSQRVSSDGEARHVRRQLVRTKNEDVRAPQSR